MAKKHYSGSRKNSNNPPFFSNVTILFLLTGLLLLSCSDKYIDKTIDNQESKDNIEKPDEMYSHLTTNSYVRDIVNHPAFEGFGKLLLPHDDNSGYYNTSLNNVGTLMPYHGHVVPEDVVEALNRMIDDVNEGSNIFYDFYTEEQKQSNPSKENTGLFFFRGNPGAPFTIICPGGGFSYVGSLHEGFPLAKVVSDKGYNAFVIRYRIGGEQIASEDLAAAISYIFRNAAELGIDTVDYSLLGGSAGARMVGDIALRGVAAYGGDNLPKPATAIIAYTGQSTYSSSFSPTFITVAANDGIVNINTVENRVANLRNAGVEVEYQRYERAGHGFGIGTGSDAEGWLDLAIDFWERHMDRGEVQSSLQKINYLWNEGNVPATTIYTVNNSNYFDPPEFRPSMVYYPVKVGLTPKGAVLICPGGAFQFRSENEGAPVAEYLSALGYQCFVVNYRLRPYTMQEGALDLARAIRIVRSHVNELGINEDDIAIAGFSAGGILCGEVLLNFDGNVNGSVLDSDYMPDALDNIRADACAVGMIYSFYGRLSVASTDVEKFKSSDLPPTYFLYGTRDPFVHQFELCVAALQEANVSAESHVLRDWPHGFGAADGQWIIEFDKWLSQVITNN
ncbi:alpha/beta hydrolase [Maribellus maritimus]|uniref:alpha/beta hydrolase n=1 Tax=Maribellus maritimus TaxID=2870838 RepID=UPI001EEAB58E|nr:alpha/beta hydrolase [Maribellus maritimus]MCG6189967.1 alpha/beta hydrolase [Maribellus maritimus]